MSAYDYCRDKVELPGSSLYYSVLFVAPALRASLTALHAIAEEFREVVDKCNEESVARAKLGWWAEETRRACAGEPRHPVTQVLAEPLRRTGVDAGRFARVLEAASEHLCRDAYRTFAELESHYERMADITGCMAAEFARDALHVARGPAREHLSDGGGAGKRELANLRVGDELLPDRLRIGGGHQIEDARRQARLLEQLDGLDRGQRRRLGGLEHDRAAGRQRRAEFAGGMKGPINSHSPSVRSLA